MPTKQPLTTNGFVNRLKRELQKLMPLIHHGYRTMKLTPAGVKKGMNFSIRQKGAPIESGLATFSDSKS